MGTTGGARAVIMQGRSFLAIGALSTVAYLVLFACMRTQVTPGLANAAALLVTTVANTAANRRFTFAVRGRRRRLRDHGAGLLAFGVALFIGTGALVLLGISNPSPPAADWVIVLVAANLVATSVRFGVLRLTMAGRVVSPATS